MHTHTCTLTTTQSKQQTNFIAYKISKTNWGKKIHPQGRTQNTLSERKRVEKRKRRERKNQPLQGIYHKMKRNNHPIKTVTSI